jgi:hypothetical protein
MAALVEFLVMATFFETIPNRCLSVIRLTRTNLLVMRPQKPPAATPSNPARTQKHTTLDQFAYIDAIWGEKRARIWEIF